MAKKRGKKTKKKVFKKSKAAKKTVLQLKKNVTATHRGQQPQGKSVTVSEEYRQAKYRVYRLRQRYDECQEELKAFRLLHVGEREAFVDWSFRSGEQHASSWQTLAEMQHHEVPTRLLDWSESPLVALYFAIENDKSRATPCVWVLDPFELNKLSADQEVIYLSDPSGQTEEDREIIDSYKFDVGTLPRFPLAISPPYIDNRLQIQMGCFTIHGRVKNGLYNMSKEGDDYILIKLKIRRKSVPELRKQLLACGISRSYLFPGLSASATTASRSSS